MPLTSGAMAESASTQPVMGFLRRSFGPLAAAAVALVLCSAGDGHAERGKLTVEDYRYFRSLSIDLSGRPPTRAELTAFEAPDFSLDAWLDARLAEPGYAERLRRIYTDVLRLEIGPSFQFVPNPVVLRRVEVQGPDGKPLGIYFRRGQRRVDPLTDGDFCLTQAESGLQFPPNAPTIGYPWPVSQAVLDARTVVVKPWWLYADYRSAPPRDSRRTATTA